MLHATIWAMTHQWPATLRVMSSNAPGAVVSAAVAVPVGHWIEPVCRCFCKGESVHLLVTQASKAAIAAFHVLVNRPS